MKRIIILFMISLALAAGPGRAARAEEEGVIVEARGLAEIVTPDGERRAAEPGGLVNADELIETGEDGRVRIVLPDESELLVQSSSRVELLDSRANPGAISAVTVYLGRLWASISESEDGDTTFEVQTPTAVAGVRGTIFDMGVGLDGSSRLGVEQGIVRLLSPGGKAQVEADQESMVELDRAPSKINKYEAGDDRWRDWDAARLKALLDDPEPVIAWMTGQVTAGPDRIKRLDRQLADDDRSWEEFRDREKLDDRADLSPEQRADAGRRLHQLYASTRDLQLADRKMMANYYLLETIETKVKNNPRAYPPRLIETMDRRMPEVRKVDPKKHHRASVAREKKAVDRADQFTRKHNLDRDLKRKVVKDRREKLKQGRDNFEKKRGHKKDDPGPKKGPGAKPDKNQDGGKKPGGKNADKLKNKTVSPDKQKPPKAKDGGDLKKGGGPPKSNKPKSSTAKTGPSPAKTSPKGGTKKPK